MTNNCATIFQLMKHHIFFPQELNKALEEAIKLKDQQKIELLSPYGAQHKG